MRGLFILLCLPALLCATPAQAEPSAPAEETRDVTAPVEARDGRIYRMTDEHGRVIFTDSPPAGAKASEVRPQPSNIMEATPRPQRQGRPPQAASVDTFAGYTKIAIGAPAPDQTFQNPQQPIGIQVQLEPSLQAGHQLRILHNGTPLPGTQLVQPARGAHTVTAQVLDDSGQVVAQSAAVTVHVHRPSVLLGPGARRNAPDDSKGNGKPGGELVQILPWYPSER